MDWRSPGLLKVICRLIRYDLINFEVIQQSEGDSTPLCSFVEEFLD